MSKNNNQSSPVLGEALVLEGVTEKDVQWWQSTSIAEKQKIKDLDASFRLMHIAKCMQDMHLSQDEAFLKTMGSYVFYDDYPLRQGVLDSMSRLGLSESDYPLPYELHGRIDEFFAKVFANEMMQNVFKQQQGDSSTMNAFFRNKIRSGEV